jgi:hypothetical protein
VVEAKGTEPRLRCKSGTRRDARSPPHPSTSDPSWLSPGHVRIVIAPRTRAALFLTAAAGGRSALAFAFAKTKKLGGLGAPKFRAAMRAA